ncbi:MAG TPA: M28 family peptidase [Bryobacteraceae bacterium]|nr:M28 family peptidase [Bryobacteraceae bacterium]
MKKVLFLTALAVAVALAAARTGEFSPAEQAALNRISAESLRANLSYLASDDLEGRKTPSAGLDRAADYIASQFQKNGLEPAAAGHSYFQTAQFDDSTPDLTGFKLVMKSGDAQVDVPVKEIRAQTLAALNLEDARVTVLPGNGAIPPVAGVAVAGLFDRYGDEALLEELQSRKPALILLVDKSGRNRPASDFLDDLDLHHAPVIRIRDSAAADLLRRGRSLTISLHLAPPAVKQVSLRNVAGLLPGSDPALRDQYVLLTAHYDHLGRSTRGIFNGANDNASGTVSVIEIGSALATLNPRPKRSILFMTFFGEEEGLLGSYYYAHSPLVPLAKTVADVNLEQMGRTDEQSGTRLLSFTFTGPSYSNLPAIMSAAAKTEGIGTWQLQDADAYFSRSDNYAFALRGMIAHTIAVAAEFPDYHGPGDKADKIDYANMAKVDRGVAAGVLRIADDPAPPRWSDAKGAATYRAAAEK